MVEARYALGMSGLFLLIGLGAIAVNTALYLFSSSHYPMLWVLGVVALRGDVVQLVDLRMCLGMASVEPGKRSRIIVLYGDDDRVTGVLVDTVDQVLRVSEEAFRDAAVSSESGAVSELCIQGEDFVSVVDVDRVLELCAD